MSEYIKTEDLRFQFVLYINDNIICQRYFNIFNFNEDSLKSLELKELMNAITGMNNGQYGSLGIIPRYLKKKSISYHWDTFNYYYTQQDEKNAFDKIDNFQFEIKVDDVTVAKSEFSGNSFQPRIRYAVDVREIIPEIMTEIRQYLSQQKYTIDDKTKAWEKNLREVEKKFLLKS
jgi:hypothetical protein